MLGLNATMMYCHCVDSIRERKLLRGGSAKHHPAPGRETKGFSAGIRQRAESRDATNLLAILAVAPCSQPFPGTGRNLAGPINTGYGVAADTSPNYGLAAIEMDIPHRLLTLT